jgi:transcriptional regulator with XRE-family HTH domain
MTSKLKEAREAAGYSIEEISNILKIRKQYIVNLEEEVFDDIPGQVYVDGYTKIYHEFLGLDCPIKNNVSFNTPKLAKIEKNIDQKYIVFISAIILVIIVCFYVYYLKYTVLNEVVPQDDITPNIIEKHGSNEATID